MRNIFSALIIGTLCASAQQSSTAPPPPAEATAPRTATSLLDVTLGFNGAESLAELNRLLGEGAKVDEQDTAKNTPLLQLSTALEHDYRYTTDPHYAAAVDEAITLLLKNGANVLHENEAGCNAAFFLQSKPRLLQQLTDAGLLPKKLAVRIPHQYAAFGRYMRKRVAQAGLTRHEASRQYLISTYCAPAYEQAEAQLHAIIANEDTRKQTAEISELLAFMRLADEKKANNYVHALRYWEHGEHLLEEVPSRVLQALNELEWKVNSKSLRKALRKLDSMLPGSPDEMIDCFAAQPMGILLAMLARNEGEKALPTIRKYCNCDEADLASTAYGLLLNSNGLPAPTPEALMERFAAMGIKSPEELTPEQRRIYECAVVDAALRSGDISAVTAEMAQHARKAFADMKLPRHAEIVGRLLQGNALTTDSYTIQATHHSYIEQPPPAPRMYMARYILEHPALFAAPSHK
ncbi:MAG: hypothetical protein Q4F38_04710 [Akkermansia sp.]|nr:hypothetical protein [Akkermansia sp.]